jgi:quercetin dioxygenase-like cupin family protein
MKSILFLIPGTLQMSTVTIANDLHLTKMLELKQTTPFINGDNIKVWSIKKDKYIRINLVEFHGKLRLHKHPDAAHSLMVLEGEVVAEVSGKKYTLSKGDFISIPQGAPHGYESLTGRSTFTSMDNPYYQGPRI